MSRKADNKQNQTNKSKNRSQRRLALALLLIILIAAAFFFLSDNETVSGWRENLIESISGGADEEAQPEEPDGGSGITSIDPSALPEYDGNHYVEVNGNKPDFAEEVYSEAGLTWENGKLKNRNRAVSYERYGELDGLGRCTYAYGCLSRDTMPAQGEERGDISSIHPSGWAKAQEWERCHLIAWALGAENANERNLVTGTHYMNYDGMRPLEEEVEHYIWDTGNHVLYLARPLFKGKELVPRGVQMMAYSVEDGGKGISFNVYCFNVTPGAQIDYSTGIVTTEEQANQEARKYVINTRSGVFHYPSCEGAQSISPHNRKEVTATRLELTSQGYTPCGYCEP